MIVVWQISGLGMNGHKQVEKDITQNEQSKISNGFSKTSEDNGKAFRRAFESENDLVISLPEGKFKTSVLNIPTNKNITIRGMGQDKTEIYCTEQCFNSLNPAVFTTTVDLDLAKGSRVIHVKSTTGAKVGQLITLVSNQKMEETDREAIRSHSAIITNIKGNSIIIDRPVPSDFNIGGYTVIVNGYKVGKVKISNLKITGEYDGFLGNIQYASGFELDNLTAVNRNKEYQGQTATGGFDPSATGGTMHGFRVSYAVDTEFLNPRFEYLSYGVMPTYGSVGTTIKNSVAIGCRHTAAPTGGSQGFIIRDGRAYNCYAGFDSHETAYDSKFFNCYSYGDEIENKFRGRFDFVEGSRFEGGILTRHDTGLRSLASRNEFQKVIKDSVSGRHINVDGSTSVIMEDITAKGYISNYGVMDLFSLKNATIYVSRELISNIGALRLESAENNIIQHVNLIGSYGYYLDFPALFKEKRYVFENTIEK